MLLTVRLTSSRLRWDFGFRVQVHWRNRTVFRLGGTLDVFRKSRRYTTPLLVEKSWVSVRGL